MRLLQRVYYGRDSPAFMAGSSKVYAEARRRDPRIRYADVRKFMDEQRTATLHHRAVRRFPRQRTTAVGLHTHLQIDLLDMSTLQWHNRRYRFLLCAVCVFSRQARVEPLKSKRPADVLPALQRIVESYANTVWCIGADAGREWESVVREWLTASGITFVNLRNSPHKASMVERFQRTLRLRLARFMTEAGSKRYLEALPVLVDAYNRCYHRGIGRAPASITPANEQQLYDELYPPAPTAPKFRFAVGDHVRIRAERAPFGKEWTPAYRDDPDLVVAEQLRRRTPPQYRLAPADTPDKPIADRNFYESELAPRGEQRAPQRHGII